MRGRKDQARLEPNLLISNLPADVTVESIVVQDKEIGVWAAYFAGLEAKQERAEFLGSSPNMGSLSGWEEVETPSLDHLSQVQRNFRTPKKLKLTGLLAVDAKTLPMMLVKPKELKQFPLPSNPNTSTRKLSKLGWQRFLRNGTGLLRISKCCSKSSKNLGAEKPNIGRLLPPQS